MALFLQILEGPTSAQAQPLVAVRDPAVICAVVRELAKRLEPVPAPLMRLTGGLKRTSGEPTNPACESKPAAKTQEP